MLVESKSPSSASSVLAEWTFRASESCAPIVIPDGCIDLITVQNNGHKTWFLTDLSDCTYSAEVLAGDVMIGLRLKPGSIFNTTTLDSWLTSHDVTDLLTGDQIDEFCQVPASLTEALHCLASGERSINSVAKALAVSTRTLQREVGSRTGKSPHFWFALARVRRACRALPQFDRLADAAISFGFADQAHMSREMKRWLGVSPSAITSQSDIFEQLLQPGYG